MNEFITWDVLMTYATFLTIVHMIVEFTKEWKIIKKIRTKYWSFIIAFILLLITNIVLEKFRFIDIILYVLSAISVSLGANGLSDFNKDK
ncbi:MAG: hypothetical protein HFH31_00110 [Bacilli bacterium]|nr:hypothetical protein [Bacilli bacterium]